MKNNLESFSHISNLYGPLDFYLDEKIFKKKTNGIYIELGAYDGLFQSNTAFLEKYRNWTGLLIEPSIEAYNQCKLNRPNSICICCACSSTNGTLGFFEANGPMNHVVSINENTKFKSPSQRLSKIIETNIPNIQIDFLSLDVEGYELEVLKGLDLTKNRPNFILCELFDINENFVKDFLNKHEYECLGNITNYNTTQNPQWGSSGIFHNDFLFKNLKV